MNPQSNPKSMVSGVALALALAATGSRPVAAAAFTWLPVAPTGTWSTVANWGSTGGTAYPNATGDTANLISSITANSTSTLTQAATLGILNIGAASGGKSFTVSGTGVNTLTFNNSSAGAQINNLLNANTISAGITLADNLAVTNTTAAALTLSGNITGTGNLTLNGNGTDYTKLGFSLTGTLNHEGSILNSGTGVTSVTISSVIGSKVTGLVQNANDTLTLSGNNTSFTGGVTLSSGTLNVNHASALGTGTFTINGVALNNTSGAAITLATNNAQAWNGDFTFVGGLGSGDLNLGTGTVTLAGNRAVTVRSKTLTVGGPLVDGASSFGMTKNGPGILVLGGTNTYKGATVLNGGVLRAVDGVGLPSTGLLTLNGGVLETSGTFARNLGTGAGAAQVTGGFSGFSANGLAVTVALGGTGSPTALVWGGATFKPLTLVLNASSANQALEFKNAIDLNNTNRVINVNANVATLSGAISGTGALLKNGAGTLVLTGANNYTGITTVTAGELRIASAANVGGGAVTVASTGALGISADLSQAALAALIDPASGGILAIDTGASATTQALNLSALGNGGMSLGSVAGGTYGAATLTAGNGSLYRLGGGGGALTLTQGVLAGGNAVVVGRNQAGGNGTLVLQGNNSYTGATTVNDGSTLTLDFTQGAANDILPAATALTLGRSATLSVIGKNSVTNSQTLNGLTVGNGHANVTVTSGAGGTANLALDGITRSAGGSLLLTLPASGSISTSAAGDGTGLLGAWAFVGTGTNTRYAGVSGGTLSGYTLGTSVTSINSMTNATANYDLTLAGTSTATAARAANTIRFTGTGLRYITMGVATNTLTLNSVINAGSGTLNFSDTGAIMIGASKELVINAAAGSTVTMGASIKDNTAGASSVLLIGGGTVQLAAGTGTSSHSFSGGLTVDGVTLDLGYPVSKTPFGLGPLTLVSGTFIGASGGTLSNTANNAINLNGDFTFNTTGRTPGMGTGAVTLGKTVTLTVETPVSFAGNVGDGGNGYGLVKEGVGNLAFSGSNNFTGPIVVNNGTFSVDYGPSVNAANTLFVNALGAVILSTSANYNIAGLNDGVDGGGRVYAANSGGAAMLIFGGAGSYLFTGSVDAPNLARAFTVTMNGTGTQVLTGANAYSGATTINSGVLGAGILASGSALSSIGISSNAATNLVFNGGTLRYLGSGDSTDRLFTVGTTAGSALDASGTGPVTFSNTAKIAFSGTAARTFTLTGSNTGDNTLAGILSDSGSYKTAITKDGAGKWILTGSNTYTGATLVNAGKLAVNGFLNASSTVTVASGATLGGSGTAAGAVIINVGGTLAPGNSISTFNTGALTVNGNYNPEIGAAGSPYGLSDLDNVTGNVTLGAASVLNLIDNAGANSQGSAGAGAHKLIAFTGNRFGSFATVNNPMSATLHENVFYNDAAKTVDLDLYRLAAAGAVTNQTFGNWLASSTAVTANLVISNTAPNDGFSEKLNASAATVSGISFGSVSGLAGLGTGTMAMTLDRSASGVKGGAATIAFQSDGAGLNSYGTTGLASQGISVTGTVYDAAALTLNTTSTLGDGGTLSIANNSGAYRSAAYVNVIDTTGANGWTLNGLTTSDVIAAGITNTSGYVLAPTSTGLLNGTVLSGSLGITLQNNQAYLGSGIGDLGIHTWTLRHTVSGNVATIGSAQTTTLVNGQSLVGFNAGTGRSGAVLGTTASFLEGTSTGGAASMTFRTRTAGVESASLFSDVVDLSSATGANPFVLQLSYNPADLGTMPDTNLSLGWNNGSAWVNALTGNTGSPTTFITATSDYSTWRAAHTGDLSGYLDVYGVDTINHTVWAVVNHNSEFAVIAVPEPAALALFALGGLTLLRRRRA